MDGKMDKLDNEQGDDVFRKPSLIAGRTKKMALTYVGSTLCAAAVVVIDSLVAGVSIGPKALAAIAAAGPLLTVEQILHCLLGYGIDKLMIQAIGRGNRREADRIFGAILIAVLVVYVVVFILLTVLARPLLQIGIDDAELIDMAVSYTLPLFVTAPIFEVFLCIERAFRIDGRARLFSLRSIITNIANIIFDILLVSVLGLSVTGLACASVIATAIGYLVTLSHFFSKKRTVSPDFSVIFCLGELLSYVKKDVRLGSSATLDEVMDSSALAVQTIVIGVAGGSGGLAIWAVFKSLRGVVLSVGNGVSASVSVHAGLLFGQDDFEGVRYAVKEGIRIALMSSLAVFLIVFVFAGPIADMYHIEPAFRSLCTQCLRIGCVAFPAITCMIVVNSYLPAVDRIGLTNRLVVIEHGLVIISAAIGYILSVQSVFALYVLATWVAALVFALHLARDRFWFVPKCNPETIADYSIQLEPDQISAMVGYVKKKLSDTAYPESVCSKVALVIEESMSYIAGHNPDTVVYSDIEMKRCENGIQVIVLDDGLPYNPLVEIAEADWVKPGTLEAVVVLGFTEDANYDRVLELNQLSLIVESPTTV